jgi:hypothetical protein
LSPVAAEDRCFFFYAAALCTPSARAAIMFG